MTKESRPVRRTKAGGPRPGAGRPALFSGPDELSRHLVLLDDFTREIARVLGDGSLSAGLRAIASLATGESLGDEANNRIQLQAGLLMDIQDQRTSGKQHARRHLVTIDAKTVSRAQASSPGNLSAGLRASAEQAWEQLEPLITRATTSSLTQAQWQSLVALERAASEHLPQTPQAQQVLISARETLEQLRQARPLPLAGR